LHGRSEPFTVILSEAKDLQFPSESSQRRIFAQFTLRVCDFFQFEETANAANRATTHGGCHPEKPKATKDLHFLDFHDARRTADPFAKFTLSGQTADPSLRSG